MYQIAQSPCSRQEEDHQGLDQSLVTGAAVAVADALAYVAVAVDVTVATMLPWL